MSYILDALRKAEAERERGTVPGIHAQPAERAGVAAEGRAGLPAWGWAVVAGGVVLAALLAWSWLDRGAARPEMPTPAPTDAAQTPAESVARTTPAAVDRPAATGTTAPSSRVNTPANVSTPTLTRPSAEAAAPITPPTKPPPIAAAIAAAAAKPEPKPAALPAPTTTGAPAPSASAATALAADRVPTQSELPEAIRRELPAITVGGSMYSPVPANRILFIGGQVFHEGDTVAPGLVLEQIRLKSAVLRYKNQRYSVAY